MGIISVGNDISSLFLSCFIAYYGGKSHRPRLISVGLFSIVIFCLMNASPHFFYGPGEEALKLTVEYGGAENRVQSQEAEMAANKKSLCRRNGNFHLSLFIEN
jgi:Organic Anion Transporter Polypeptide (OATP) family